MEMRKAILLGAVAGTATLLVFALVWHWFNSALFKVPLPPLSAQVLQTVLRALAEGAPLGAVTGAAAVLWRSVRRDRAKRICITGGALMTLLLLGPVIYQLWHLTSLVATGKTTVSVPLRVPWQVYFVLTSVMFNLSLQWAILLMLAGAWLPKNKLPQYK